MARISRFYPKNVRPFILLKSRCSTAFLFERRQPTFYSLQQVNKKMVNISLKKKSQHSVLKKCVTIWTVESDAKSILAGALRRFALAFVLQDFLGLCMPRQRVAQCTTPLVCTKISKLSAHHICPDLVVLLLSSAPSQN